MGVTNPLTMADQDVSSEHTKMKCQSKSCCVVSNFECKKDSNKSISLNFKLISVVCAVTFILTEQSRIEPLLHQNQHWFRLVLYESKCNIKCGAKEQSRFGHRELHMSCPTSQISIILISSRSQRNL